MFNFMPSPDMMARLGIQGQPGGPDNGQGAGGPMSMLQNPQFLQSIMQRANPGMGQVPNQGNAMPGRNMMPMPNPMQGGAPSGPPQKPGMMSRFGSMATAAAPMFSNMLMEDERKKEALRYR